VINVLCYHLLSENSTFLEPFAHNRLRLKQVSDLPKLDDSEYWRVLSLICEYQSKYKKLPSAKALHDFVNTSSDLLISRAWTDTLAGSINELKEIDPVWLEQCSDPNVMMDEVIRQGRIDYLQFICQRSCDIALNGPSPKRDGNKKDESGPDDAKQYLIRALSKDVSRSVDETEGVWQENTEAIALRLNEYLSGKQTRVFSGFFQIDRKFVMRLGKTLVIAGNSGDGKSLFANSMIYNMACNGERILYNALEFSVDEVWESFAFIHQRKLRDQFPLPPKSDWTEHDPQHNPVITQEDVNNMTQLLTDIKAGSVPGLIDVVRKWTLEEFLAYYEANDPKRQYSVVVIDYASHLRLENNFRNEGEKQAAIDNVCAQLISWTHEKGKFLFITPAQIGKTAAKEAIKRWENLEDDDPEDSGYTLDSLYYGNALKQDGDFAISVFSPDDLKLQASPEMIVKCHKHRLTKSFGTIRLSVDTSCDYAFDANDPRLYFDVEADRPDSDGDDLIDKKWKNPYAKTNN
jgi:hypothetical protein